MVFGLSPLPESPPWLGPFLEQTRQMIRRELVAAQKREIDLFKILREHEHWMASIDPGDITLQDWEFIHQQLHAQLNDILSMREDGYDAEYEVREIQL